MTTSASPSAAAALAHAASETVPDTEVLRLLAARGSVRNFKPDPIPDAWVDAIIDAGQRAPTSSNIQAYSIVVVRNPETKVSLAELAGNQQHIIDCPVFFALCADLNRPAAVCEMHGLTLQHQTLENGLVASVDVALLGMSMTLAADSLGLGTVMIGGMRNHPVEVARLLKLPPHAFVVFGLCLGFPKSAPIPKPRLPRSAVVHDEVYGTARTEEGIAAYDAELAEHYRAQNRQTPDAAWTQVLAQKFSQPNRAKLREHLRTLGVPLE